MKKPDYLKSPWQKAFVKEGHYEIYEADALADPKQNPVPIAVLDHSRDGHEPTRVLYTPAQARMMESTPDLAEALHSILEDIEFCKDKPGFENRASAYAETAKAALLKAGYED